MIAHCTPDAMRVYLVAHTLETLDDHAEMLRMRGYDVRTGIDALRLRKESKCNGDTRMTQRTAARLILESGLVALAPDVCHVVRCSTIALCAMIGVPVVPYEQLPVMPPEVRDKILVHDLTR